MYVFGPNYVQRAIDVAVCRYFGFAQVYRVEPVGPVKADPGYVEPGIAFECRQARIVEVRELTAGEVASGERVFMAQAVPELERRAWARLDRAALLRVILAGFSLPRPGVHGVRHWSRVLDNGLRIAALTTADPEVVALFAIFHDARRVQDSPDPASRAA